MATKGETVTEMTKGPRNVRGTTPGNSRWSYWKKNISLGDRHEGIFIENLPARCWVDGKEYHELLVYWSSLRPWWMAHKSNKTTQQNTQSNSSCYTLKFVFCVRHHKGKNCFATQDDYKACGKIIFERCHRGKWGRMGRFWCVSPVDFYVPFNSNFPRFHRHQKKFGSRNYCLSSEIPA